MIVNVFIQTPRIILSNYIDHGIISILIIGFTVRNDLSLSYTIMISSVSEYYLSRHRLVDSYIPDNATVIIVSDDPGFTVGVTEMTLFFMMLSFTQGLLRLSFFLHTHTENH
jgi:hypothetical protein